MSSLELKGEAPKIQFVATDNGGIIVYLTQYGVVSQFALSEGQAVEVYQFFKEWMESGN